MEQLDKDDEVGLREYLSGLDQTDIGGRWEGDFHHPGRKECRGKHQARGLLLHTTGWRFGAEPHSRSGINAEKIRTTFKNGVPKPKLPKG